MRTKNAKKNNKLRSLCPFIDATGIMRVGGRLENSEFSYDKKHPIIVPYGSELAKWIIDEAHKRVMHGGNQLTLSQIRHTYWLLGAKRAVKAYINKCIICHRFRAKATRQLMGSLPSSRTRVVEKPFTNTGTDLAGPIKMKMTTGRGQRTQKGYIVLFICMSTRAVHIEAVSDQSAEAFIAAFNRFVARRGNVQVVYSDNGTNFVAANKILQLENEQAMVDYNMEIKNSLAVTGTKFKFNPPSAPWFGGIWERHIGSIKYHLKRVIGDRILTFEELTTVLAQIEACINSRPMTPLSDNPNDLEVLTPGHFLVGNALTAPVEANRLDVPINRLHRWELCCRLKQEFWSKWTNEYLSQLQSRSKWTEKKENLQVGDMVLLMDEVNAPLRWPLARVTKVYPARDDLVRVVDIKTRGKTLKRPVGKLALLPIDREQRAPITENQNAKTQNTQDEGKKTILAACTLVKRGKEECNAKRAEKPKLSKIQQIFMMILCLVALFGQARAMDEPFKVEKLPDNTWLYAEKCEKVIMQNGVWNMFTHINLGEHHEEINQLHQMTHKLEKICEKRKEITNEQSACDQVKEYVDEKLNELNTIYTAINMEMNTREKRGPVMVAGLMGMIVGILGTSVWNKFMNGESVHSDELMEKEISLIQAMPKKWVK